MEIIVGDNMDNNPASVNIDTGICRVNPSIWTNLNEHEKKIILLHEAGHIAIRSVNNEDGADQYALEQIAGKDTLSLRNSVAALIRVLSFANVGEERQIEIIKSALKIDSEKFGNKNAEILLQEINGEDKNANVIGEIISAIPLIVAGATYLFGKRNAWAKSGKLKDRNKTRESMLITATQLLIGDVLKKNAEKGEQYILDIFKNIDICEEVHKYMYNANCWKDNNILSRNFSNSKIFFKIYPWARDVIRQEFDLQKKKIINTFSKQGKKINLENYSFILYAVFGVFGVFLIYKLLKS